MEASEESVAPLTGLVFAVRTGVFGFLAGCAMNKDKALVQARTQLLKVSLHCTAVLSLTPPNSPLLSLARPCSP